MTQAEAAQPRTAGEYATSLVEARDRLLAVVATCPVESWSGPLSAEDPRPVGVVADHVADAYGYLGGWIAELLAGGHPTVSGAIVDDLNAQHARAATGVTRADAATHLQQGGDAFAELVRPLADEDLEREEGRLRRMIEISIRHTDSHRAEIESALSSRGS